MHQESETNLGPAERGDVLVLPNTDGSSDVFLLQNNLSGLEGTTNGDRAAREDRHSAVEVDRLARILYGVLKGGGGGVLGHGLGSLVTFLILGLMGYRWVPCHAIYKHHPPGLEKA